MSNWVGGSGHGGLDAGTIAASTPYFVWIIQRPDTGVVDYLISLSSTAPTMPTSYTVKRGPVAWFKTDATSNILQYQQRGDEFIYGVTVLDVSAINVDGTAVLTALNVPLGVQVNALIRAQFSNAAVSAALLISGPDETDQAVAVWLQLLSNSANGIS